MYYLRIKRHNFILGLSILIFFFSCFMSLSEVYASEPENITVSNVTGDRFTISWTTDIPESSQINYGLTTSFGNTAYDERGQSFEGTTHYITISGLNSNTTYYYDIVSGGVTYDNSGNHYAIATGITLPPAADSDIAYGQVFLSDGGNVAEGAIVYIKLSDNDGSGTDGDSQIYSSLVDDTGNWHIELKNIRNQALDSYFDYSDSRDNLVLEAIGPNGETASQIVDTSEDTSAPSMMLESNVLPAPKLELNVTSKKDRKGAVAGEIIIEVKRDIVDLGGGKGIVPQEKVSINSESLTALNKRYGLISIRRLFSGTRKDEPSDIYVFRFPAVVNIKEVISDYRKNGDIIYVEPNYIVNIK